MKHKQPQSNEKRLVQNALIETHNALILVESGELSAHDFVKTFKLYLPGIRKFVDSVDTSVQLTLDFDGKR